MSDALLYSVAEAAKLLGISEESCRQLIITGRLHSVKMPPLDPRRASGRRITKVPRAALEEFVASLEADTERAG